MQRYEVLDKVGEGTYGIVLRCLHRKTGTSVAIKQFKQLQDEDRVSAKPADTFHFSQLPCLTAFWQEEHDATDSKSCFAGTTNSCKRAGCAANFAPSKPGVVPGEFQSIRQTAPGV